MTKRKITIISALLLAAVLALPLPPPPVMAGGQCWYLTDTTTGVPTGADYLMYRGSGIGAVDALQIPKGTAKIWAADEPSNIVIDMDGTWTVTLLAMTDSPPTCDLTADIGILDSGGAFGSRGAATQTVGKDWATVTFNVTTNCLTLNPGEYLAIKLTTQANKGVYLDVLDTTSSPCYITSDAAAPDYPGTVIISFTVTDYNSDGIDFGSLNPGATDQPADQTPNQGTVTLIVGAETNVPLNIQLKGTDFNGSGTMAISNVKYDDDNALNEGAYETGEAEGILTTSYVTWYSVPAYTADTHECYHWVSVPGGQSAGDYTSTFYYQADIG